MISKLSTSVIQIHCQFLETGWQFCSVARRWGFEGTCQASPPSTWVDLWGNRTLMEDVFTLMFGALKTWLAMYLYCICCVHICVYIYNLYNYIYIHIYFPQISEPRKKPLIPRLFSCYERCPTGSQLAGRRPLQVVAVEASLQVASLFSSTSIGVCVWMYMYIHVYTYYYS
jgi:hypothetical protein